MIEIVDAKDGNKTIIKDGKYLLSKYKPRCDIERLLTDDYSDKCIIIFSGALGYFIDELLNREVAVKDIYVYELDDLLVDYVKHRHPSIQFITIESDLTAIFEKSLLNKKKPVLIAMPSFKNDFADEFALFKNFFYDSLKSAIENIKVSAYFSKVWFINYIRNIARLPKRSYIDLCDVSPKNNANVIVCAAGPSLNNHINEIKNHRDKFIILSVLSATRTLVHNNIIPDAIVINDGGVANCLHAYNLPDDIPILAGIYASSALLSTIPNPVVYYLDTPIFQPTFGLNTASVTIDAGILAQRLFTGAIVFIGFDLAYSAGQSHSRGNAIFTLRSNCLNRTRPMDTMLTGYYRRSDLCQHNNILTNSQFLMVKDLAETMFKGSGGCYYLGDGVEFDNLQKVDDLDSFSPQKSPPIDFARLAETATKDKIIEVMKYYRGELIDNADFQRKIFVRETLADLELGVLARCYARKIDKMMKLI